MYNLLNTLYNSCGKYQARAMRELRLAPNQALHVTSLETGMQKGINQGHDFLHKHIPVRVRLYEVQLVS